MKMKDKLQFSHIPLMFISNATDRLSTEEGIALAVEGGCRWVQLRMKGAQADEVAATARRVVEMCHRLGVLVVIDDHPEVVREAGADGVHLGREDMPVTQARALLGDGCIIGGTANTIDDIRRLSREGADYIGCGPFRFTTTKARERLAPLLGLGGYREIVAAMRREGIGLPLYAIGGIEADDLKGLFAAGVDGVAVSGSVLRADDPRSEVGRLLSLCPAVPKPM